MSSARFLVQPSTISGSVRYMRVARGIRSVAEANGVAGALDGAGERHVLENLLADDAMAADGEVCIALD